MPAGAPEHAVAVTLEGVTVTLGGGRILDGLDLEVRTGEFLSLLAPSGVGKSTILNVIAGFLPVEQGRVLLSGVDVTRTPPHRRNLGFIFQEYALFPHMTVEQNVRFPLDMRKVKRNEARRRVKEVLDVVGLPDAGSRKPDQLSGGQRQRVAIARAMVFRPDILLMDEPLSSLDRQLRDEMTVETRRMQRELGVTVLYVTHDQTEALSLSDRIGIVRTGRIEQVGPPKEVHDSPSSVYAAHLCGPLNVVPADLVEATSNGGPHRVRLADSVILVPGTRKPPPDAHLAVRPYLVRLQRDSPPDHMNAANGVVTGVSMIGNGLRYEVDIGTGADWHVLASQAFPDVEVGAPVHVVWPPEASLLVAP